MQVRDKPSLIALTQSSHWSFISNGNHWPNGLIAVVPGCKSNKINWLSCKRLGRARRTVRGYGCVRAGLDEGGPYDPNEVSVLHSSLNFRPE
jgi:hypothetical protein